MREKREVVFIVYKVGWWGCFDSIYREMCSDKVNQCVVVQLPFYKRDKRTGKADLKKCYYSEERLPGDIPVTSYREYSFEDRKPDIIFIHNPYDNQNEDETVEPSYYSWNLKKYTKELVYVPHMLFIGSIPTVQKRYNIYQYVDKVYLPENRARYSLDVAWDSKVQILPSGIVNYMDRLIKNRTEISLNWRELYCRKDSVSKRTVIMYYIGFEDLQNYTERILKKTEYLFDYLKTRKDILLVLRLDEDIPANFSQLPDNVAKEFQRVCNRFIDEKMGIYDSSEDIYASAVIADVLLTSGNQPMKNLFGIQGKLSLCINLECQSVPAEDDFCVPSFWDCVIDGEKLWFVTDTTKLICTVNMNTGELSVEASVPDEVDSDINYLGIERIEEYLYLAPYQSDGIWKYNMKSKGFEKLYLPDTTMKDFAGMVSYRECLFLVPRFYPGILCYDLNTEEFTLYDDCIKELDAYGNEVNDREPYIFWGMRQEKNILHLISSRCGAYIRFDMDSRTGEVIRLPDSGESYADLEIQGKNVWMLPCGGSEILKYDIKADNMQKLYTAESSNVPYARFVKLQNNILAFPREENNVLKINMETDEISVISGNIPCNNDDYQSAFLKEKARGYQMVKKINDNYILAYEIYDGSLIIMDEDIHIKKKIKCRVPYSTVLEKYVELLDHCIARSGYKGLLTELYPLKIVFDYLSLRRGMSVDPIRKYYRSKLS